MKYKSTLNSFAKENKFNLAKVIFVGFVLILAFIYFSFNSLKVDAVEEANVGVTITGTIFDKDGNGSIAESEKNYVKNKDEKKSFFGRSQQTPSPSSTPKLCAVLTATW